MMAVIAAALAALVLWTSEDISWASVSLGLGIGVVVWVVGVIAEYGDYRY